MSKELVVIDDGIEVDWYDPIDEDDVKEEDTYWIFNNGFSTYVVDKKDNRVIVIRDMVKK